MLAIVALIATPIVLNVVEDSKKSAAESEANIVLSGLTNYCNSEDFKIEAGTLTEENRKCKEIMDETVIRELVPNLSSDTTITNASYKDGKIINLRVMSSDYAFEIKDGSMVSKEYTKVKNTSEFLDAIEKGGIISLEEDIVMSTKITITKDIVIDLNGNKFDASSMNGINNTMDRPFWMTSGSSLTINAQNSEIALGAHGLVNIANAKNVNVTLNGGSYTGPTQNGALIRLKAGADKVNIDLNNVEYNDAASDGYIVSTTGFDGSGTMTVNGGSYAANYGFQIYGLEATLNDVKINTQGTAIEASSSSNVTVENCDITINNVMVGMAPPSGIAASQGGTITVNNSNFQGTMEAVYYVYWDTETNSGGNIYATNNNIAEANYTYRSFKRSWAEGEIVIDGVKVPDN